MVANTCLLVIVLLLVASCQKVLGDYTVVDGLDVTGSTCAPRAVQCVGNVLQRCNSQGTAWENASACASETLCDPVNGVCKPPRCNSNDRLCIGAELHGCNGNRDGFTKLADCVSAGHCSAESRSCTAQACEPGQLQCNGAVLQSCKSDRSGWTDYRTCASAALCNVELGECTGQACNEGQFNCAGSLLRKCNATLNGWDPVGSCHSDVLCDAENGVCINPGCTTPGAFRCLDTGALERCADDLAGWVSVSSCASVAHCDALNGVCNTNPCKPGDHQCNGSMLQVCNSSSTGWDLVDTCETDGLCQQTLALGATRCSPPACDADSFRCDGAQPQACNAALTDFRDNGDPCLTEELCNAATGTCGAPVCDPGQTRCNGAQPEVCNPGQTGFVAHTEPCASAPLCRDETGTCGDVVCLAGQKRCDPANPTRLQLCNATLDGWDDCDTCATAGLCSASLSATTCGASSCIEPTCALQDRWCGGTGNRTLYKCPASRINSQPEVVDICDTQGLCEATRAEAARTTCIEPTCALQDRWCGGTDKRTLYKCPPSLINSQAMELDECETERLCEQAHDTPNAMTCPEPACAPGFSCGGANSRELRRCNADRTGFESCDTCDTAALCTASLTAAACNMNSCQAAVCTAGEKSCMGSQLRICNAGRTGYDMLATCGSATLCMNSLTPASQMTCDECVKGTFNCDGAQPQRCNDPDTGPAVWEDDGEPCADAASCVPTTGTCEMMGSAGAGGL